MENDKENKVKQKKNISKIVLYILVYSRVVYGFLVFSRCQINQLLKNFFFFLLLKFFFFS
jgi:hypothetical protein